MSAKTNKHLDPGRGKVIIRRMRMEDIPGVIECDKAAYPDVPEANLYGERRYTLQLAAFPEGQFVAVADGKIVGFATSIIVNIDDDGEWYTYEEITGAGTSSTHTYDGDTLYGSNVSVRPDYRGRGIAGRLYDRRKTLLRRYNLRRMIAYGRIPGYKDHAGKMSAEHYVEKVKAGELSDMALNAHLKAGYLVRAVRLDLTEDVSSLNYATLLEMPNPDFQLAKKRISAAVVPRRAARRLRVCAAQYQFRALRNWAEVADSVEFFVDMAHQSHCHFLLFPEYFTYQFLSTFPSPAMGDFSRALAECETRYREMFTSFAKEKGLYIVGGTLPVEREGKLYNTAFLFTPSGNVYEQEKLHVTPSERNESRIEPGRVLQIFDTPLARIAVQVCYDVEFPEISRLLALSGVEVVFVPFYTEEKKSYWRVRHCAQARAVENFFYVVLSGNVGNLKTRIGSFISYGQSAILTPSDFPFPERGVQGEADPNAEAVVISELALSSLAQQRHTATVRPLHDRRNDLYVLTPGIPIKIVPVE